jgi:ESCRT-II complex subunit VPS25
MASSDSGSAMQNSDSFIYPWEYEFPPFFTIQPNLETRKMQLEAWRSLILDYCQHKKIQQLNLREFYNKPPFCNQSIDRRLSWESLQLIITSMVDRKYAEWLGRDREECLVYSRPPEQWAQIIYGYVKEKSLQNTIMTFYELLEDESTESYEFHGLDETIFFKALKVLERSGKAAVIEMDGNKGVKFV